MWDMWFSPRIQNNTRQVNEQLSIKLLESKQTKSKIISKAHPDRAYKSTRNLSSSWISGGCVRRELEVFDYQTANSKTISKWKKDPFEIIKPHDTSPYLNKQFQKKKSKIQNNLTVILYFPSISSNNFWRQQFMSLALVLYCRYLFFFCSLFS